jgi:hypothetical protein
MFYILKNNYIKNVPCFSKIHYDTKFQDYPPRGASIALISEVRLASC